MFEQPRWTRFLPARAVVGAATLGPVGHWRAPGTWGSVAGLLWYTVVCAPAGPVFSVVASVLFAYGAIAVCGEAEFRLGKIDPPEVVLDEFVSMPLVLLGLGDILATPEAWVAYLLAFGLFRFFDILKPAGIGRIQRLQGGAGVVLDDVAAAVASCAVLHLVLRLTPLLAWVRGGGAAVLERL
jgi:phosphatidylglycerophosphatase A